MYLSKPGVPNSISERDKIKNWDYVKSQTGSTFKEQDRHDIGWSAKRYGTCLGRLYILILCTCGSGVLGGRPGARRQSWKTNKQYGICFLAATSLIFGVRFFAEDTLRMEWRFASVRRLLCGFLCIFITKKSCSQVHVLRHRFRDEPWRLCSAVQSHTLTWVSLNRRSVSSFWIFTSATENKI